MKRLIVFALDGAKPGTLGRETCGALSTFRG